MLIKLSEPPAHHAHPKPPIHTLKNHDSYNGILHLPIATHVAIVPVPKQHNHNPHHSNPRHHPNDRRYEYQDEHTYKITLLYPHARACHITRSRADVLTLRARLAAAGCVAHTPITPDTANTSMTARSSSASSSASSSSLSSSTMTLSPEGVKVDRTSKGKATQADPTTPPPSLSSSSVRAAVGPCRRQTCSCPCACPCLNPRGEADHGDGGEGSGHGGGCWAKEAREAGELNALLGIALGKIREGRDKGVEVPVEWFLRRRIGDCEG